MSKHIILGCSPRKNGNSDTALNTWVESHPIATPLQLRSANILPCIACGSCACDKANGFIGKDSSFSKEESFLRASSYVGGQGEEGAIPNFGCPLVAKDTSLSLISALYSATTLCIVSPIYFYFLPAPAKALVDRLQPFWERSVAGKGEVMPKRRCYMILISGKAKGEKLFEGSLLSLKYALSPLGYTLEAPLLLRGYDSKNDLASDSEALQKVKEYASYAFSKEHE